MGKLDDLSAAMFSEVEKLNVTEWAEKYRVLPPETSRIHGPMNYGITPYLRKIANSIMQENPAQIISIMKGSQLGFSIGGLFSMMGWAISQDPGNILFITETLNKVKEQMQGPISEMINNSDLVDLVGNHNVRLQRDAKGSRNTRNGASGDTSDGLKFKDGKLYTWSGKNIGSLSSWSIKYGIYDEIERWKGHYKNAGDFMTLVEPRHKSFADEMKMIFGSTPEVEQTSNIKPLYLLGNQEKYHIPCPHCGAMIDLVWNVKVDGEDAGIVYKRDKNGKFIDGSAEYICQLCSGSFKEKHKFEMYDDEEIAFRKGQKGGQYSPVCDWIPTAEAYSWRYQSFQISSLYAPSGFFSWNKYASEWCEIHPINAPIKIGRLHGFINQTLGDTWVEKVREITSDSLRTNQRNYAPGIVPDILCKSDGNGEIVLLTCAIDLNGVMGNNDKFEDDDVRLDYEVVAWCESGDEDYVTSYSVDHGSIGTFERSRDRERRLKSKTPRGKKWTYRHGANNNVWDEFTEKVLNREWLRESGIKMKISICGVDTGNYTKFANKYVYKHLQCVALKGDKEEDYTKFGVDKLYVKKGTQSKLYRVENNNIKDKLADEMELGWDFDKGGEQPNGFMNFPLCQDGKYTKAYFKEYEGEKRDLKKDSIGKVIGMRWQKKATDAAQHFFDCRVYNIAVKKLVKQRVCDKQKVEVDWKNLCTIVLKKKAVD